MRPPYFSQGLFGYAISNLESIIKSPNCVSERLKNDILHSDNVSRDKKIDLFISMMPNLSEKHIEDVLKLLDLSDYLKIFDVRSRPKFEINSENKKLLTAFKENSLINNFEENSDKSGYYKIIRIKPTKS